MCVDPVLLSHIIPDIEPEALAELGQLPEMRLAAWAGPLLTGAQGTCPLYSLFGLSTCPAKRT